MNEPTIVMKRGASFERSMIHAYMVNYQRSHGRPPVLSVLTSRFGGSKTAMRNRLLKMVDSGIVEYDFAKVPAFTAVASKPAYATNVVVMVPEAQ